MELDAVTSSVLKEIDAGGWKQEGAYNLRFNGQALCHGDSGSYPCSDFTIGDDGRCV